MKSIFPLPHLRVRRGTLFGILILTALLAFEIFNFSTTDFALRDLLGNLRFAGLRWATILAVAFCGIDFAGIARLFTPEEGADEPKEVWYLFGAWLLAATMNALLTWWGVSIAILEHRSLGNAVIAHQTLLKIVPVFVAIMVWLIRVLIIGTFSVAGERLFSVGERQVMETRAQSRARRPASPRPVRHPTAARPTTARTPSAAVEPTYHPLSASAAHEAPPRY